MLPATSGGSIRSGHANALYGGGGAAHVLSAGISSALLTARTSAIWTQIGLVEQAGTFNTNSDFIGGPLLAADLIATAGLDPPTKLQVRVIGVVACSTIMGGAPSAVNAYFGIRRRAIPSAPAAAESTNAYTSPATLITNTAGTFTGIDTGWHDSGITVNCLVDMVANIRGTGGTDNSGAFGLRVALLARAA